MLCEGCCERVVTCSTTSCTQVSTFHKALQTGLEYERQTKALLLRLDLIRNDMSIKASRGIHGPPRGDRDDE